MILPVSRRKVKPRNPIAAIIKAIRKKIIPDKKKYNRNTTKNFGFD